jgi:O-antigen/teichoic acid export membrane protein
VLAGWVELLGVALRARGRPAAEAAAIVVLRAGGLVGAWIGLASGLGLAGVAAGLAASPLPALVLAGALVGGGRRFAAGERSAADCLRNALPLGVNGALALASLRVEVLALAALRASREAGLFAAGLRVVEFLLLVPAALCAGAMPALTREGLGRGSGVRSRIALTVALAAAPAAAGLWLVAPGVVTLLFGPEFASAGSVVRILAFALPALFLNSLLLHALMAVGRRRALPRLTGVRTAAAVLLALLLVPALDTEGAAIGFVASEWLLTALAARACRTASFPVPVVRPLLLSAAATAPMAWALWGRTLGPVPTAALGLALYGATIAASSLLLRSLRSVSARSEISREPAASEGHVGIS